VFAKPFQSGALEAFRFVAGNRVLREAWAVRPQLRSS